LDDIQKLTTADTGAGKIEKKDEDAKKSNWIKIIEKERQQARLRKTQEEEERAKRLARLFKFDGLVEDSDDEENLAEQLDRGAAEAGIDSLIDKVEVHLAVEMNILRKWKEKD